MTTNQTIDGVPRELVRENIAYLRGMGGTYDQKSALAAKFELLLLDPAPLKDLREQYEAWADSNGYDITRNEHGDYAGIVEDSMWTGWQARGKLRALLDAPAQSLPISDGELVKMINVAAPHSDRDNDMFYLDFGRAVQQRVIGAQPQGEPVAWVECSPAWLKAGGDCATAPRLCVGREGISHMHPAHATQPAPVAVVLAEAREWLGDGKHSDGLTREHWTPEYAALIDRIDATLRK